MNNKTEESRITYNKIAYEYDTSREGRYTRFHINELVNTINLREGNVVLDVACGNGTLLGELSKKAQKCVIPFHHFDNPQGFVNECRRVLKKNGEVYIANLTLEQ